MPTGDIKKILYCWEEFQSLATKWHPNKAEMNRLCALFKTSVWITLKTFWEKREVQSTLDRFFTSPLAKRLKKRRLTLNKLWKFGRRIVKTLCTYFQFNSIKCIIYFQYNSVKIVSFSFYFPFSFIQLVAVHLSLWWVFALL